MLSNFNVIFLVSLAIISWIVLCIINSQPTYQKSNFTKGRDKSKDIYKLWMKRFLALIFRKGPNLSVYLICTLLGVFILINIIARKVKTFAMVAARNEAYSNLLVQISRLKEENAMLLTSLKQQKLEKKEFVQHFNVNAALSYNLETELCLMKERYERVRRKLISLYKKYNKITEESSNTSASYYEKSKEGLTQSCYIKGKPHNEYFHNPVYALKNSNLINEILKEAYEEGSYVLLSKGNSNRNISNDCLLCDVEITSTHVLKEPNNVNIVSTDQLQKIKGTTYSSFLPEFN